MQQQGMRADVKHGRLQAAPIPKQKSREEYLTACGLVQSIFKQLPCYDLLDLDRHVRLAVTLETPMIFAAFEVLDKNLGLRQPDDLADDARPGHRWLTNLRVRIVLQQQDPTEFDGRANLSIAEIDVDDVAFLNAILAR